MCWRESTFDGLVDEWMNGLAAWWSALQNVGAGEVIVQGQEDENCQPDESCAGENPGQAAAVADVHEVENDQGHLHEGNGHGDDAVEGSQIDLSETPRGEEQRQQQGPDKKIKFWRNRFHTFRSMR